MKRLSWISLIVALTLSAACDFTANTSNGTISQTSGCFSGLTPIAQVFNKYLVRWDDAYQVASATSRIASATSRIALSGPVTTLQNVRRDAASEGWPPCAQVAAKYMDSAMQDEIDGYVEFMRGSGSYAGSEKFDLANIQWSSFHAEINRISN